MVHRTTTRAPQTDRHPQTDQQPQKDDVIPSSLNPGTNGFRKREVTPRRSSAISHL